MEGVEQQAVFFDKLAEAKQILPDHKWAHRAYTLTVIRSWGPTEWAVSVDSYNDGSRGVRTKPKDFGDMPRPEFAVIRSARDRGELFRVRTVTHDLKRDCLIVTLSAGEA